VKTSILVKKWFSFLSLYCFSWGSMTWGCCYSVWNRIFKELEFIYLKLFFIYIFRLFWCINDKNNFFKIKNIILIYFQTKNTLNYIRPLLYLKTPSKRVLDSVVAVAFQITFCAEMHANYVFLFFKNYFLHQHIKTIQNVQIILNFSKKKN